jgi:multicomponent Na+:H+ antiporter subunit E
MTKFLITLSIFWCILVGGLFVILSNPFLYICSLLFGVTLILHIGFTPWKIQLRYFRYFLWLAREIFNSAVSVTKYVYGSEKYYYSPKASWIKSKQKSDFDLILYANSITLTPGTITVDIDGKDLLIHALDESSIRDLGRGEMDGKIRSH